MVVLNKPSHILQVVTLGEAIKRKIKTMTTKELADHHRIKYVSLLEYGVYSVAFLPDEALRMVNPSLTGKIIFHKFSRYFV